MHGLLSPDLATGWAYGQTFRYLKHNGLLIGANDLWIAATAIGHDFPLVTRNTDHFRRVPGLRVAGH
ncbi:MAG: type II toxin-antitoxin system VapC family toxin [Gemmatimonadetes bacterium]|nr:type II toxin-antitoxin system VapC family toxin [Gemmatimonadota bacterium]NNM04545.1 type II toxin-antitoxin system VapC family toxin [Gemmatimonadota bacterium]